MDGKLLNRAVWYKKAYILMLLFFLVLGVCLLL